MSIRRVKLTAGASGNTQLTLIHWHLDLHMFEHWQNISCFSCVQKQWNYSHLINAAFDQRAKQQQWLNHQRITASYIHCIRRIKCLLVTSKSWMPFPSVLCTFGPTALKRAVSANEKGHPEAAKTKQILKGITEILGRAKSTVLKQEHTGELDIIKKK